MNIKPRKMVRLGCPPENGKGHSMECWDIPQDLYDDIRLKAKSEFLEKLRKVCDSGIPRTVYDLFMMTMREVEMEQDRLWGENY